MKISSLPLLGRGRTAAPTPRWWPQSGGKSLVGGHDCWCGQAPCRGRQPSRPHLPASLLLGCSILRSASSSSTNAGSVGEAASSIGESCCHRLASPVHIGPVGGGDGLPKSVLNIECHLWWGGRRGEDKEQWEGDRGRSPLLRPGGWVVCARKPEHPKRWDSLEEGTGGSHLPGATSSGSLSMRFLIPTQPTAGEPR